MRSSKEKSKNDYDREIAVVVPFYSTEQYIYRCLDSILNQIYQKFELYLVDDGSFDNCGKICDEYVKENDRLYSIHKNNGGLSDARNVGINFAFENCCEWISFIDSDDWVHSLYLQELYNAVMETGCQISISNYQQIVEEDYLENPFLPDLKKIDVESFYCDNNINAVIACGKLYKKQLFIDVRFPFGKIHEDEFTTYKLLFKDDFVAFQAFPLYYYYYNNNSITKSKWTPQKLDSIKALEEVRTFFRNSIYQEAFILSTKRLIFNAIKHYNNIMNCNNVHYVHKYLPYVRKKLRKYLFDSQVRDLFPIKNNAYYYEKAFPKEMKIYWYYQSLKSKLKRK